jgi:hypothetical protein
VFKNRVLRRIFGPKRDEATGDWRRLHPKAHNVCIYTVLLSLPVCETHSYIEIIIQTRCDTPLYVFVMAHYTIYATMCAELLHVSTCLVT